MALVGCAGGHILSQYGTAASKVIKTSCRGEYRVSEKDGKLLVSAYAVSEAYHSACESPPPGRTGIPYEFVAVQFLQESNRPRCVITAGERLELLHSEFAFICPPTRPSPATTPKKS
jgi:hypothetical protein